MMQSIYNFTESPEMISAPLSATRLPHEKPRTALGIDLFVDESGDAVVIASSIAPAINNHSSHHTAGHFSKSNGREQTLMQQIKEMIESDHDNQSSSLTTFKALKIFSRSKTVYTTVSVGDQISRKHIRSSVGATEEGL